MGFVNIAVNQPSGRALICYVTQESTSFIYNRDTNTFDGVVLADIPLASRAPYRFSLLESPTNTYKLNTDVTAWDDGDYKFVVREVSGLVEYLDLLSQTYTVSLGDPLEDTLDFNIKTSEARTLFAYVVNLYDKQHLKVSDYSFDAIDILRLSSEARHLYRLPYTEISPGTYTASLDSRLPDGTYQFSTLELVDNLEVEAGAPYNFTVLGGKRVTASRENLVAISHNSGGVDSLRYLTTTGEPVGGAQITAYLTSDIAQGIYTSPLATSSTDSQGRWSLPISLESAEAGTYTIIFEKSGYYGPDSVEV
jgi:hypothetical protein